VGRSKSILKERGSSVRRRMIKSGRRRPERRFEAIGAAGQGRFRPNWTLFFLAKTHRVRYDELHGRPVVSRVHRRWRFTL
jgi:hypothetical protein